MFDINYIYLYFYLNVIQSLQLTSIKIGEDTF